MTDTIYALGDDDGSVLLWDGGFALGLELPDPYPDFPGAPYDPIKSYCASASELLLWQFRDKPKIRALLCSLVAPYDRMEAALWGILTRVLPLDQAEGANLDLWGRVLNAPRRGLDDDKYRVRLRVRMLALRSNGRTEEIYAILRMALGQGADVKVYDAPPATVVVEVGEPLSADAWIYSDILTAVKGGGVRLVFITNVSDDTNVFTFDDGSGADGDLYGFGSINDPDAGGKLASAKVM